jgi:dTDP-4-amino-4,6-dideoxygalactose transaminase
VFENLEYANGVFPVSEDTANRIFSIPMHPYIARETQDKILNVLAIA